MKLSKLMAVLLALCFMIPAAPMALGEEVEAEAVEDIEAEAVEDEVGEIDVDLTDAEGLTFEEEEPEDEVEEIEQNLVGDEEETVLFGASLESEPEMAAMNADDETARPITDATIDAISDQPRTSNEITPDILAKIGEYTLVNGTDYDLTYANNINVGTATITVTGKGAFSGTRTVTFNIVKGTVTPSTVTISLKNGHEPTKVYDKTANVSLKSSDFDISVSAGNVEDVKISKLSAAYDKKIAGDRKVTVTVGITANRDNYSYELENSTFTIDGKITPKTLTITPTAGQSKVFGATDPSLYKGKVSGLMSGDKVSGKLSREPGENVGNYKITAGTIVAKSELDDESSSSYTVVVKDETFEIKAKSINATDIGMVALGNEKWTGSAIEPEITLKYGTRTLEKGTDYDVEYTNNVNPGTATVTITGKGNYTGTRTSAFRILKVSSGTTVPTSSNTSSGTASTSGTTGTVSTSGTVGIPSIVFANGKGVVNVGSVFKINLGNLSAQSIKSSKKKVATVDKNGVVTARRAGKTKITIKFNKKTKLSITLTVLDPTMPTKITLNRSGIVALDKRDTLKLGYTLAPGTAISGVKWKSSNRKIATVVNGVVTPRKTGTVTITAITARGKKKAKVKIRIVDMHAPASVSIQQGRSVTIKVGSTIQLNAVAAPSHTGYAPITTYKWSSSKKKVASVNKGTGLVTAKKPGTTKVTVKTANKKKAVITIKVIK